MNKTIQHLNQHAQNHLDALCKWLSIPSISANSTYKTDVLAAAEWTKNALEQAGLDQCTLYPTPGFPVVCAAKIINPQLPTVLVYGHYDVQPADPLELWDNPPFEPTLKNGRIYARGAADDKGQVYMHIAAINAMIAQNELPCNVKFLIEGEEEVGSTHLNDFVLQHKSLLACDCVLISDTSMLDEHTPSITTGVKGLAYLEVCVTGPNRDLHSGIYGGAVANPINVLCNMIASLHDEEGRINIPEFYTDVKAISPAERAEIAKAPFDLENYKKALDITDVKGEKEYSTLERTGIRPTLDVNGIWGGYTGEGAKTVLPSKAYAKISMRLVPNQTCAAITQLFKQHFTAIAPPYVKVEVKPHHGGNPATTNIFSKAYQAASKAMEHTYQKSPIPIKAGGSIPIVAFLQEQLNTEVILMGFGLDSDAIHSPNESYKIENFTAGMHTIPWFYHYFTNSNPK